MLVTMKEILDRASAENYGVAAPNAYWELDARAYLEAAEQMNAPVIIDINFGAHPDLEMFVRNVKEMAEQCKVPVAINLDHGGPYDTIVKAIRYGMTSVMIDRSATPLEQNIAEVKEIVKIAHAAGISVEAELGHVGQANNYAEDRDAALTSVEEAKRFVDETGVDCLAVAIGTAHGAYPKGFTPYLDFERLVEIKNAVNIPLVLHGGSGTKNEDLSKACSLGINKVNIANDLCRAAASAVQEANMEGSAAYFVWTTAKNGAREKLKEMIRVYGSENKAWTPETTGLLMGKTMFEK